MRRLILLCVVVSVLMCGCSNQPRQSKKMAENVSGTVTFNDKAIADAVLNFFDRTRNIDVTAKTDTDGKFTVPPRDLPVGRYSTFITPVNSKEIPSKYQNPMETPLVLEVKEGTNDWKIVLEK